MVVGEVRVADNFDGLMVAPREIREVHGLSGLLRDLFLRNDPASYAKACRAIAKAPSLNRELIGHPTLLVVGDHDRSTPIAMTEELHRDIPVSQVRVISSAAHWLPLEHPDALSAAILPPDGKSYAAVVIITAGYLGSALAYRMITRTREPVSP